MLDMKEVRTWDAATLKNKIKALEKDVFNLRSQLKVSGIEKPHQLGDMRKDIARLNTALKTAK